MMNDDKNRIKNEFIYPKSSYRGEFTPENMMIDANLQEFALRISYICNLETNGKITAQQAYFQIKQLWQQLSDSAENLGIDKP